MAKAKTAASDVLSRMRLCRPGTQTWFERLPADAQAELEAVRTAYDPGIHVKASYARAIIEVARERGWSVSGIQGVIDWLNRKGR